MSSPWKLDGEAAERQHESPEDVDAANPFAAFAFGGATAAPAPAPAPASRPSNGEKRKNGAAVVATSFTRPHSGDIPKKKKGCKAERIDFGELSAGELRELRARWRGMADRDAAVEDQRFQVLVGAVLSSRAQATVVDEGLSRLRAREGGLTAAAMSTVEQDDLAEILRHVHWNKAKAKHIRESASMIVRRHRGFVPRRRGDLLALPGVGPALVEILLNVFDSWEADDTAVLDTGGSGGGGGGNSGGEAGRADGGSTVDDGAEGCGGSDDESERRRNSDGDRPVDDGCGAVVVDT